MTLKTYRSLSPADRAKVPVAKRVKLVGQMLGASAAEQGGIEALRKSQASDPFFTTPTPEAPKPRAKGKPKPEPKPWHDSKLTPLVMALREYERTSYYLAMQGHFNFDADDQAQRAFHSLDPSSVGSIEALTAGILKAHKLKVPAGHYVEGLNIRTIERMKREKSTTKKKGS